MRKFILFIGLLFVILWNICPVFADDTSLLEKGMGYYYQKDWEQAITAFKASLQENPKNSMALSFYLVSNLQKGTLEKVIEEIEDKLVENPKDPVMQSYLGFAMYTKSLNKGRQVREDAMREFRGAAIQEALALTHTGLGLLYQDRGQISRARKEFIRALELDNKDLLAMEYLGQLYLYEEKKSEDAAKLFVRLMGALPNYPDVYYYIARIHEEAGRLDEAVRSYKRTMELDPSGVGRGYAAPAYLGEIYLKQKQYPLAADSFRTALKFNPRSEVLKQKLERAEKGPAGENSSKDKDKKRDKKGTDE